MRLTRLQFETLYEISAQAGRAFYDLNPTVEALCEMGLLRRSKQPSAGDRMRYIVSRAGRRLCGLAQRNPERKQLGPGALLEIRIR